MQIVCTVTEVSPVSALPTVLHVEGWADGPPISAFMAGKSLRLAIHSLQV